MVILIQNHFLQLPRPLHPTTQNVRTQYPPGIQDANNSPMVNRLASACGRKLRKDQSNDEFN